MYNPEEDIIDPELLAQALAISSVPVIYKVYFDKDTGNILSISNEENKDYLNSIDVEFEVISDFLKNKKQITNYKIVFVDLTTPAIVSKFDTDVKLISIEQVKHVDHWDNMFTIENYPLLEQWGFQLRSDQRAVLQSHNLSSQFEIFVVDKNNSNMLLRTIKLSLKSLIESDRIYVSYQSNKESDLKNRIFVRKFFSTIGYQILYDANS